MVPCVIFVLYEVELYAYWLWRKISSGASRCDREFYVEDGPMGDRRYTEVIHAFNSDTYQSFQKEKNEITRDLSGKTEKIENIKFQWSQLANRLP